MKTFIITALSLLSAAAAAPTSIVTRDDGGLAKFKLKPGFNAPPEIKGRGYVEWNGFKTNGGELGWFTPEQEEIVSFIQYNSREGISFYAKATRYNAYLRPTNQTPAYLAKVGNPGQEKNQEGILQTLFSVSEGSNKVLYFGYDNKYADMWSACKQNGDYILYYGANSAPKNECTKGFNLEVEYTS